MSWKISGTFGTPNLTFRDTGTDLCKAINPGPVPGKTAPMGSVSRGLDGGRNMLEELTETTNSFRMASVGAQMFNRDVPITNLEFKPHDLDTCLRR